MKVHFQSFKDKIKSNFQLYGNSEFTARLNYCDFHCGTITYILVALQLLVAHTSAKYLLHIYL